MAKDEQLSLQARRQKLYASRKAPNSILFERGRRRSPSREASSHRYAVSPLLPVSFSPHLPFFSRRHFFNPPSAAHYGGFLAGRETSLSPALLNSCSNADSIIRRDGSFPGSNTGSQCVLSALVSSP